MADDKDTKAREEVPAVNPVAAETPEEAVREQSGAPEIPVAADPSTVFETPDVREVEAIVDDEPVEPQTVGKPPEPVEEVPVYEVHVTTDERVDYVIVPPEGRGDATLPLHAFVGAKTPEQQIADES